MHFCKKKKIHCFKTKPTTKLHSNDEIFILQTYSGIQKQFLIASELSFPNEFFYIFGWWCKCNLRNVAIMYDAAKSPKKRVKSTDREQSDRKPTVSLQWFCHWFRRSDFVTKWGFGQDGSGDSKIYLGSHFSANRRCSRSVCRGQLSWTPEKTL